VEFEGEVEARVPVEAEGSTRSSSIEGPTPSRPMVTRRGRGATEWTAGGFVHRDRPATETRRCPPIDFAIITARIPARLRSVIRGDDSRIVPEGSDDDEPSDG
jgi:hypothetical protein